MACSYTTKLFGTTGKDQDMKVPGTCIAHVVGVSDLRLDFSLVPWIKCLYRGYGSKQSSLVWTLVFPLRDGALAVHKWSRAPGLLLSKKNQVIMNPNHPAIHPTCDRWGRWDLLLVQTKPLHSGRESQNCPFSQCPHKSTWKLLILKHA